MSTVFVTNDLWVKPQRGTSVVLNSFVPYNPNTDAPRKRPKNFFSNPEVTTVTSRSLVYYSQTVVIQSGDIFSGQDTYGWPPEEPVFAPSARKYFLNFYTPPAYNYQTDSIFFRPSPKVFSEPETFIRQAPYFGYIRDTGLITTLVPTVVGLTQVAATTAITTASLVTAVTTAYSNTVPLGIVISQVPIGGTNVFIGTVVNIVVSLGVQPPPPPTYVLIATAIQIATQAGFDVIPPIPHAYSLTVPYGYVISQSPAAGTLAPLGTAIIFIVSDGLPPPPRPTPNIPNVLGMMLFDAERYIEDNGCNVNPLYVFQNSSTYPQGSIMAQSPGPTNPAIAGTVVTLTVSLGPTVTYYGTGSVVVPLMH